MQGRTGQDPPLKLSLLPLPLSTLSLSRSLLSLSLSLSLTLSLSLSLSLISYALSFARSERAGTWRTTSALIATERRTISLSTACSRA